MPVTSKLISVTAPSGPPIASRPALSGDCDAFGAVVNTVVSDTASKATSVVTPIALARAGSTPGAGSPGTEGGNMTSPGASGAPGPVVTGAASVVSRGTPLTVPLSPVAPATASSASCCFSGIDHQSASGGTTTFDTPLAPLSGPSVMAPVSGLTA